MLSEKRVREAEINVKMYLDEGLLKKERFNKLVFERLKGNAMESLDVENFIFDNRKSDLWIVVISYYAMYYIANAVLYEMGYKVGHKISHKVTADALVVFVRDKLKERLLEDYESARDEAAELVGIKADELIANFDLERRKRSSFHYNMTEDVRRSKAEISLNRAKNFVFEMEKLLIE